MFPVWMGSGSLSGRHSKLGWECTESGHDPCLPSKFSYLRSTLAQQVIFHMLLKTNKFPLLVFETKNILLVAATLPYPSATSTTHPARARGGSERAKWWSEELGSQVWSSELGDIFLVLSTEIQEENGIKYMKVLHQERTGWIRADEWLGLEEVDNRYYT